MRAKHQHQEEGRERHPGAIERHRAAVEALNAAIRAKAGVDVDPDPLCDAGIAALNDLVLTLPESKAGMIAVLEYVDTLPQEDFAQYEAEFRDTLLVALERMA